MKVNFSFIKKVLKLRQTNRFFLKVFFLAFLCVNSTSIVFAGMADQSSGEFLTINPDTKFAAMGDGGVALADTPAAIFSNPAGIASMYQSKFYANYASMPADMQYNALGINYPMKYGNIAASLYYLGYGNIQGYKSDGTPYQIDQSYDSAFAFTYALPIKQTIPVEKEILALGATAKVIHSVLTKYVSETATVDLGLIYHIPKIDDFDFGVAYKNLGGALTYEHIASLTPTTLSAGFAYKIPSFLNSTTVLDANIPNNGNSSISAGIELNPVNYFSIRCGWKQTTDALDSGLRVGFGFNFIGFNFNYAYTPYMEFGGMHRVGLEFPIGKFVRPYLEEEHNLKLHFEQAKKNFYNADYIATRQELEEILSIYPNYAPAKEYLVKLDDKLTQQWEDKDQNIKQYLAKAEVEIERQNLIEAERDYNIILKMDPENVLALEGQKNIRNVIKETQVDKNRKKMSEAVRQLWEEAVEADKQKAFVKARELFSEILEFDPNHTGALTYIAEIDNQMAKVDANQLNQVFLTAKELFDQEKYKEAIQYFEAVLKASPKRQDVQDYIKECNDKIKNEKEHKHQENIFSEQKTVKEELNSKYNNALRYFNGGNYQKALDGLETAYDIADKYQFAETKYAVERYMLIAKEKLSDQYYRTGLDYFQASKFDEALENYRKSLQYNSNNTLTKTEFDRLNSIMAQRFYEDGMRFYTTGDIDKARENFKVSLTYKPDKEESRRALERLK